MLLEVAKVWVEYTFTKFSFTYTFAIQKYPKVASLEANYDWWKTEQSIDTFCDADFEHCQKYLLAEPKNQKLYLPLIHSIFAFNLVSI